MEKCKNCGELTELTMDISSINLPICKNCTKVVQDYVNTESSVLPPKEFNKRMKEILK